jgi:hypothetical protein
MDRKIGKLRLAGVMMRLDEAANSGAVVKHFLSGVGGNIKRIYRLGNMG